MYRWLDRVALVTGSSVGIGRAICEILVEQGLKVVGCARNVDQVINGSYYLSVELNKQIYRFF